MTLLPPLSIRFSQSEISIQIERFVQDIVRHDSPAFKLKHARSGSDRIEQTRLSRYCEHIQQMVDLFSDSTPYDYSEHLQAFWEACQSIGLERGPSGFACLNESGTSYLGFHDSMNVLVAKIRQLTREQRYRRRRDDRQYQAQQHQATIADYVDWVLDRYSRTVVVRVNLYYHSFAQPRLRVERAFEDLNKLIRARERNPIFAHETGYICCVEQGEDRGYHIHAAFFFKGAEVRGDLYKAQQIGEVWARLTLGQGYSHSCNHEKDKYGDRLGIGTILRSDKNIRSHVHDAMLPGQGQSVSAA